MSDPTYDYNKLGEATRQLRQVESEIDGKDWTRKTVQQLSRTLMDVREILMGTQNKAAEIEIGSALHRHVVSAVQYAEALQGAPDTEMLERIRIGEVLTGCLKSVADQVNQVLFLHTRHAHAHKCTCKSLWSSNMHNAALSPS